MTAWSRFREPEDAASHRVGLSDVEVVVVHNRPILLFANASFHPREL